MHQTIINKEFGREAFGSDPAFYHRARPGYPDWVFDTLLERCGLATAVATFEIGAGTGIATARLLEMGADPLVAIEPDGRLAAFLNETLKTPALTMCNSTFEAAELPKEAFSLGFCATAFHWLDEDAALVKIADFLKPGGWWAAVWNVFGDPDRADPFHDATKGLLAGALSPAEGDKNLPFALDVPSRTAALQRTGKFENISNISHKWSLHLNAEEAMALYATYSNINIRPDRTEVLKELGRIVSEQFDNRIVRNMTTILYIARRR